MEKDVKQTWFFKQSPQEIWDYLTRPELLKQWMTENDFKPVVGHKFQFIRNAKTDAYCQVLEIIPGKLLSYSWRKGKNENEITVDSVVTWTLAAKNGGTELLLSHNGFTRVEDTAAHNNGWNFCLNRMTEIVNSSSHADANA